MTLLVRTVGGTELTPYESNCCKSCKSFICVLRLCVVCVCCVQQCLRERTSDPAPAVGNCVEVNKVGIAGGQMSKRLYYRPLNREPLSNSVFDIIGMQIKQTMAIMKSIYSTGKLKLSSTNPQDV